MEEYRTSMIQATTCLDQLSKKVAAGFEDGNTNTSETTPIEKRILLLDQLKEDYDTNCTQKVHTTKDLGFQLALVITNLDAQQIEEQVNILFFISDFLKKYIYLEIVFSVIMYIRKI